MIEGYIQLSKALQLMDMVDENNKPVKFQVKFVTANRKLKTGGEIIEIVDGRKCVGKRHGEMVFDNRPSKQEVSTTSRPPNHTANSTRNILLTNGGIRKVHIRLMIEFNNQKIFF
jgi:hypothetical protein